MNNKMKQAELIILDLLVRNNTEVRDSFPDSRVNQLLWLVASSQKIEAIKLVRSVLGTGLAESKHLVERISEVFGILYS